MNKIIQLFERGKKRKKERKRKMSDAVIEHSIHC